MANFMAKLARTIKGLVAIFIIAVSFLFAQKSFAITENFDSYTASSSVSAISASWASTTPTYAYISRNVYGSSSPQSAQLLADTFFHIPDSNIGNYFTNFSFHFRFQNATFSLFNKSDHYIGQIIFDKDASDGYGDIYLTNYAGFPPTNYITIAPAGTIADDEWRMLTVDWDETNSQYRAKLDTTSYTAYATTTYATPSGLMWSSITGGSPFYIDDFIYNDNEGDVSVIEIDEDNLRIQVGSEYFNYTTPTICCYDCNETCYLRIFYTYPDIGSAVYLLPQSSNNLIDAVDFIENLPDSDQLIYDLTPTQRTASATDEYYIFVYDTDLTTSTLYEAEVIWRSNAQITSATSSENYGFIRKYLGKVFPLSIIYQIKDIFDRAGAETNTTKLDIKFNDILPAEYTGYTSTSTILSAGLINNNLSFWQLKVYPSLQALIWIIALLIAYFEIKGLGKSDTN